MRDGGGFHPCIGHFSEEPHARGEILNDETMEVGVARKNNIIIIRYIVNNIYIHIYVGVDLCYSIVAVYVNIHTYTYIYRK